MSGLENGVLATADDNPHDVRMSFGDHLEELRTRLIRAALFTLAALVVTFIFQKEVMEFVTRPYQKVAHELRMDPGLKAFGTSTGFFAYMQVALVVALLVSAPAWMYQIWAFVAVGLYPHERRWAYRFLPLVGALFVFGVAFGYLVLIPMGLQYLLSFGDPSIVQNWVGLDAYLSMFAVMTLVLGLMFQLPVLMSLTAKLGILGVETFRTKRRYFILGTFIVSAIVTPPDYVSQLLMAFPTLALYELGIFLAWLAEGERRAKIRWATWRKRGLWFAVAVAVFVVFSSQIRNYYASKAVAGKFFVEDDGQTVPYLKLFAKCRTTLGFEPAGAYKLRFLDENKELWCVYDAGHVDLVRVEFQDDRLTVLSEDGATTRLMLQQAAQAVTVQLVSEMKGADFIPQLLRDLRYGAGEQRPLIWRMIDATLGALPDVPRFKADSTVAAIDEATDRLDRWWKAHGDFVYHRAR